MSQDERLLKALAVAFVDHPRATLKELAEAAGVSKATLHRCCGTRDNLVDILTDHSAEQMKLMVDATNLTQANPLEALRQLIEGHLRHRELLLFLIFQCRPDTHIRDERWQACNQALDSFFLRGQRAGVFRIDVSAAVLTELFASLICGIVDAERRGRAASSESARILEQFFLQGAEPRHT